MLTVSKHETKFSPKYSQNISNSQISLKNSKLRAFNILNHFGKDGLVRCQQRTLNKPKENGYAKLERLISNRKISEPLCAFLR